MPFYVVRKLASEKSKREEKKEPESESLADKVSCLASFIHPQKGSAVIYELNERYSIELRHEETSRVVFSCSDYNLALSVCMLITDFPFECFSDL